MKAPWLLILSLLGSAPALAGSPAGYREVQKVRVPGGFVQVLEDARLSSGLRAKLWDGAVDPVLVLGENDPAARPFKAKQLVPARLRQILADGSTVVDEVPDDQAPIARIETRRLGPASHPIFLITTDDAAGFGSYSGLGTGLYQINKGRLTEVVATADDGKTEPVRLARTLKSEWKIIDARPGRTVIEQLFCRPDLDHGRPGVDPQFELTYVTYWTDGRRWRVAKRVTPGFWEDDDAWPSASVFPIPGS